MERKLIEYLPPVLQEIIEYMTITSAEQPEIDGAWDALKRVMDNQFIDTATDAGVQEWEDELDIIPHPSESLDDRKARIKTFWISGVVYTYNWLVQWLRAICGDSVPLPEVDDYTLRVKLPITADYNGLLRSMRQYIAANILIDPTMLITPATLMHYTGAAFRIAAKQRMASNDWDVSNIIFLTDETGIPLVDGAGYVLFEEGA